MSYRQFPVLVINPDTDEKIIATLRFEYVPQALLVEPLKMYVDAESFEKCRLTTGGIVPGSGIVTPVNHPKHMGPGGVCYYGWRSDMPDVFPCKMDH